MDNPFPVTYSTLSPAFLVSQILPEYGLGEVAECRFYSGGFNDTYRVITHIGETYYLRVYRTRWRSQADVAYELDALNHLRLKGVPVAYPLPRPDGSFFREVQAPEGRRFTAVFNLAPGVEPAYDAEPEDKAYRYGQVVARLHNAMDDFTSPHERFHINLELLIDQPLRCIQPFLSPQAEAWEYLQRFAGEVRQHIIELPATKLEQGFCHGDLQGYHHRIAADGTMTFIDFDCCGYGFRAYDLAVFRWCERLQSSRRLGGHESVWWAPYLRGYQEIRRLHDLDVHAIPWFVACRYIWHMGVHTQNSLDWGSGWLNEGYFTEKLGYLRQLEAEGFVA